MSKLYHQTSRRERRLVRLMSTASVIVCLALAVDAILLHPDFWGGWLAAAMFLVLAGASVAVLIAYRPQPKHRRVRR